MWVGVIMTKYVEIYDNLKPFSINWFRFSFLGNIIQAFLGFVFVSALWLVAISVG